MAGDQNRDHIVKVPEWFKFLVAAKIVIAVVVLGLAAYGATFKDWFGGNGYAIFCAIVIFLTEGYYLVSTLILPNAYNCWAYLILSAFQFIWWLSCWANLAAWAAAYSISYGGYDLGDLVDAALDCTYDDNLNLVCPAKYDRKKHRDVMGATAGIAALEWILVVASLIIFGLALHRHRMSGAPFTHGGAWRATPQNPQGTPGGVEAQNGNGKAAMQRDYQMYPPTNTTPQPAYQPPQQATYQQQPQQGYQQY